MKELTKQVSREKAFLQRDQLNSFQSGSEAGMLACRVRGKEEKEMCSNSKVEVCVRILF